MTPFVAAASRSPPAPGPLTPASIEANVAAASTGPPLRRRHGRRTGRRARDGHHRVRPRPRRRRELWDLVGAIPGPLTEAAQALAAERWASTWCGPPTRRGARAGRRLQRRGGHRPRRDVLGVYRKTHLFPGETRRGPPRATTVVVSTPVGRIGSVICFDGDFPELARIEAVQGAEVRGAAVGVPAGGRHLGADHPGPGLRQPHLRRGHQRRRASTPAGSSTSATR